MVEEQRLSMSEARTEFRETRFFKRATEVLTSKDDLTFVQRESYLSGISENKEEQEEKKNELSESNRCRSFSKTVHGGSKIFGMQGGNQAPHRRTDLLYSNTLQPISSDNEGNSQAH